MLSVLGEFHDLSLYLLQVNVQLAVRNCTKLLYEGVRSAVRSSK